MRCFLFPFMKNKILCFVDLGFRTLAVGPPERLNFSRTYGNAHVVAGSRSSSSSSGSSSCRSSSSSSSRGSSRGTRIITAVSIMALQWRGDDVGMLWQ